MSRGTVCEIRNCAVRNSLFKHRLYMKTKRSERESERRGRNEGVIGPWKYTKPDAWVYRWEELDKAAQSARWELARVQPNRCATWTETTGYPFWVACVGKLILGVKQHDNDGGERRGNA